MRPIKHTTPLKLSEIPEFVKAIDPLPSYFPNKVALHLVLLYPLHLKSWQEGVSNAA